MIRLLAAGLVMLVVTGCARNTVPRWLQGEWVLDTDATLAQVKTAEPHDKKDANIFNALAGLASAFAVPLLKDMTMEIRPREVIVGVQGQRMVTEVTFFEATKEGCSLKAKDGKLQDYHRTETGFWILSDKGNLRLHFKRKPAG